MYLWCAIDLSGDIEDRSQRQMEDSLSGLSAHSERSQRLEEILMGKMPTGGGSLGRLVNSFDIADAVSAGMKL